MIETISAIIVSFTMYFCAAIILKNCLRKKSKILFYFWMEFFSLGFAYLFVTLRTILLGSANNLFFKMAVISTVLATYFAMLFIGEIFLNVKKYTKIFGTLFTIFAIIIFSVEKETPITSLEGFSEWKMTLNEILTSITMFAIGFLISFSLIFTGRKMNSKKMLFLGIGFLFGFLGIGIDGIVPISSVIPRTITIIGSLIMLTALKMKK